MGCEVCRKDLVEDGVCMWCGAEQHTLSKQERQDIVTEELRYAIGRVVANGIIGGMQVSSTDQPVKPEPARLENKEYFRRMIAKKWGLTIPDSTDA